MVNNPTIYLAGAIRDNRPEDIAWRERFIESLDGYASFLNPLAGKWRDERGVWLMSGRVASAQRIVPQDLWCVRRADIVIANFSSFADNYPSIGTVMEVGAAAALNKLIYAIVKPGTGMTSNPKNFTLHPFIAELCADVFENEDAALDFLKDHLRTLNGMSPSCLEPVALP